MKGYTLNFEFNISLYDSPNIHVEDFSSAHSNIFKKKKNPFQHHQASILCIKSTFYILFRIQDFINFIYYFFSSFFFFVFFFLFFFLMKFNRELKLNFRHNYLQVFCSLLLSDHLKNIQSSERIFFLHVCIVQSNFKY